MTETTTHRYTGATTAIGVLTALYAVTFFLGALLHLGGRIPLGFAVLAEPRIIALARRPALLNNEVTYDVCRGGVTCPEKRC